MTVGASCDWSQLLLLLLLRCYCCCDQDVGFTHLDNETLNAYFHDHIPRAVSWSEQ